MDLCFQCKLCYPNCPYTPPHEFAVDFPRLLLRWKAHRTRRQGVALRTRLMRDTAAIGQLASRAPGMANWALGNRANRAVMEKVMGIHRDKLMPAYHPETFPRWWQGHRAQVEAALPPKDGVEQPTPLKVALFSTCLVDYNDPEVGTAAVRVLEHNGVEVVRPDEQVCCGMPFLDGGDLDAAAGKIRRNVSVLGCAGRAGVRDRDPVAELQPHGARGVSAARRRPRARRGWRHTHTTSTSTCIVSPAKGV